MMGQPDYRALVEAATTASGQAYAPYSHFSVGAAVLTASGRIIPGCNIENAAFGAGICAERTALVSAYAAGERDIVALAVVTPTASLASPCGICRQVILELAPGATIVLANRAGEYELTTPQALLPGGFTARQLMEGTSSGGIAVATPPLADE